MRLPQHHHILEQIAHELAVIGIRLHEMDLLTPYRHVVEARTSLLADIDDLAARQAQARTQEQ